MATDAKKKKRIMSSEELSSFCDQIALMLSSGMTLRDGIEMLAEDEMKGNDKVHPYTNLYKVVDETGSLYVAMKENEEEWPSYMIEMVDIGEQTGRLEDIMKSLSTYYQREGRIRSAAVSAITYPLILGVMLVIIIGVLLWRVLPIFRRVLASLGVDATGSGSVLMKIGSWAGWIVLGLIGLLVICAIVIVMDCAGTDRPAGHLRDCNRDPDADKDAEQGHAFPEEPVPTGSQTDRKAFRLPGCRNPGPDAAQRFPHGKRAGNGAGCPG